MGSEKIKYKLFDKQLILRSESTFYCSLSKILDFKKIDCGMDLTRYKHAVCFN